MFVMVLSVTTMKAPEAPFAFLITEPEPIYPFGMADYMLRAFVKVESNFNENAVNPVSGARGILQILPVMIKEVNRILVTEKYTWDDAFDAKKSIEIWYIVQGYHNPEYTLEKACQIWFGIGIQYNGWTWVEYLSNVMNNGGYGKLI